MCQNIFFPCSGEDHSDFNDVFGSNASDNDEDFETFLENSKMTKKKSTCNSVCSEDGVLTSKAWGKAKRRGRPRKKQKMDKDPSVSKKDVAQKEVCEDRKARIELMEEEEEVAPRKPRYKRRVSVAETAVVDDFLEAGLDSEDIQMFKLAMARLKDAGDPVVEDIPWAHYPHNILT